MSLLEGALAELVLDTPLRLADNDRLVLRDISARLTLAGARVVTLNPPRRGKRKPGIYSGCTRWLLRKAMTSGRWIFTFSAMRCVSMISLGASAQ